RRAGRGDAERLMLPAPPLDLVETGSNRTRIGRGETEGRAEDDLLGMVLQTAVAIAEVELAGRQTGLGPVAEQDIGGLEDAGHVPVVGTGIGPDRAADR